MLQNLTEAKANADKPLQEIKKDRLEELEQYKNDGVLEPSNVDFLSKLIRQAQSVEEVENLSTLSVIDKSSGLIFQPTLEKVRGGVIGHFSKDEKLSFKQDPEALTHELVIGDNFEALLNLLIEYKGKIDCIYIDPPYGKDAMGGFADTNYENKISRDNLLSMLKPRLELAKELLSPEGVIFCSIDDKNQAYVELLFNEVFGERNFVACCPRKTGAGNAAAHNDSKLRIPYDYLLVYKCSNTVFKKKEAGKKEYGLFDLEGEYKLGSLQVTGSHSTRAERPNLYYPIYVSEDGYLSLSPDQNTKETIVPKKVHGEDGRWMWSKEKFEKDSNNLVYKDHWIYKKVYKDESEDQTKYQIESAWLDSPDFSNGKGTKELQEILGDNKFSHPKPVELIEWCVNLVPKKDALVLDFFAGSGTTGQAVLELNKKDGGKRRFILCTNNLEEDGKIAEKVTAPRLKRVMTGSDYDGTSDFPWAEKNEPLGGNFLVLDIDHISDKACPPSPTPFDVIDETLYGEKKFKTVKEKIAWVCENFDGAEERLEPVEREEGLQC